MLDARNTIGNETQVNLIDVLNLLERTCTGTCNAGRLHGICVHFKLNTAVSAILRSAACGFTNLQV